MVIKIATMTKGGFLYNFLLFILTVDPCYPIAETYM